MLYIYNVSYSYAALRGLSSLPQSSPYGTCKTSAMALRILYPNLSPWITYERYVEVMPRVLASLLTENPLRYMRPRILFELVTIFFVFLFILLIIREYKYFMNICQEKNYNGL